MAALETALRLVISGDSKSAQKSLTDLEAAAKKAGGSLDAPSQKLGALGDKMTGAGKSMSVGVTLPLLAIGAGAVSVAAKFETSMNQVQAASGASAAELQDLSKYAQRMGADTVFSAGEAADAMLELAKSGMTPAQIKAGGLKATMDLAAAGNLALADAATVTSNAMNTFGLEAKDAATVAAALAGGANASSADVSDLALALSQVGPGAKTAGLSLQQTVAVLSEFADKGIRGSDAGTSLKTMLTRLVPTTDKAAGMMERLGISFVNSDGSMKSISQVAEILQQRMGGLSDEQKTLAMNVMFGSDATRAATILMEGGAEGLAKYTKATNDQSAATDMANARMKGMGGALENMKGSLETAGISIGTVLAPGISKVAGAIKWLADGLSGMPKWLQVVVVGLGLLLAAAGPVLVVVGKLLSSLQSIRNFSFKRQIAGGPATLGQGLPGTQPSAGVPGTRSPGSSSPVIDADTRAFRANTAAVDRNTSAERSETPSIHGLGKASKTSSGPVTTLGSKASTAQTAVGTLGGQARSASPKVGTLGSKAGSASGTVTTLGTASKNARGGLLGMDKATVKSAAAMAGLAIAITFTMNQLSKLGNAIDQMNDAAKQAEGAKNDALANAEAQLARIKKKYGEDSPQYQKFLKQVEAIRKQIQQDAYKKPWWASAGSSIKGGVGSAWNWAFGGAQASGGSYIVKRPTLFLAGEAGAEQAAFTPLGSGAGAAGDGKVVQLHVHVHAEGANFIGTDRRAAKQLADMVGPDVRAQIVAATGTGF